MERKVDSLLSTSGVTTRAVSLPALGAFITEREVSSEIVVAISTLAYAVGASNDYVALERVAGTVGTIGIAGTDDSTILTGRC